MRSRFTHLLSLDLPFARDDANRFLPYIVAFMVFVTGLMLAGGLSLSQVAMTKQAAQMKSIHVQIAPDGDATAQAQKVLALLQQTPGIEKAAITSHAALKNQLKPWLGSAESLDFLPLPVLIEAEMSDPNAVSIDQLKLDIKRISPSADLTYHARWMAQFARGLNTLMLLAIGLAIVFLATTAMIVILTAKTGVKLHGSSVTILHSVGAQDNYIARQFQINSLLLAGKGALIGAFASAVLYAILCWLALTGDSPLLPHFHFTAAHGLLFLALPAFVIVTAMLTTRFTVLAQLRKLP